MKSLVRVKYLTFCNSAIIGTVKVGKMFYNLSGSAWQTINPVKPKNLILNGKNINMFSTRSRLFDMFGSSDLTVASPPLWWWLDHLPHSFRPGSTIHCISGSGTPGSSEPASRGPSEIPPFHSQLASIHQPANAMQLARSNCSQADQTWREGASEVTHLNLARTT